MWIKIPSKDTRKFIGMFYATLKTFPKKSQKSHMNAIIVLPSSCTTNNHNCLKGSTWLNVCIDERGCPSWLED